MNPSTEFQVIAKSDNVVTLKKGYCNINGAIGYTEDDIDITLNAAGSQPRIDRIVLRLDDNTPVRNINEYVLYGVESANPIPPQLTRVTSVHELCVASIYRPANSSYIKQSDITDTRLDTALCGVVSCTIKEADTTTLYAQIQADLQYFKENEQADFILWFDTIKGKLSEDVAGNLQLQIDDLDKNKLPITYNPTWENITNKPSSFTPSAHTHDDRYYTETEVDNKLSTYILKGDFVTLSSTIITPQQNGESLTGETFVNYPSGFNKNNCTVIGLIGQRTNGVSELNWSSPISKSSLGYLLGNSDLTATLRDSNIRLFVNKSAAAEPSTTISVKVTLMRI